ncbi:hypothetical protein MMC14_004895 [Varicellaria rhodocarpa]|nr:hypothetical protein [Varicellaria rhodocarpa]
MLGIHADRGNAITAIYWVQGVIVIVIVAARFYARRMIRARGADDWWMLLTLLDFLCIPCVVTYQAHLGGFRHLADVNPRNLRQVGINNYILQTLGIFAFGTGKVSVGCLILRLLPPSSVWRKWFIWSTIVFVFLFDSVNCVITFVQCSPPRALWDPQIPHTCWDPKVQTNIAFGGTAYNIFVDAAFALLPTTIIWKLNMNQKKRIELCVILGLGLLAAICGIVKITYLGSLGAHADLTWATYDLVVWSGAEIFVIIVCGSVPPLKPLWDRYVAKKPIKRPGAYEFSSRENGYAVMRQPHSKNVTSITSKDRNRYSGGRAFDGQGIATTTDIEITSTKNSII